jgi:hypothetical protein
VDKKKVVEPILDNWFDASNFIFSAS